MITRTLIRTIAAFSLLVVACDSSEQHQAPAGADSSAIGADSDATSNRDAEGDADSAGAGSDVTASDRLTAGMEGLGPLRIGMPIGEAMRLRPGLNISSGDSGTQCYHVSAGEGVGASPRLMIVDGTVARVEVDDSTIATPEGARVGNSVEQIKTLYGSKVRSMPHKYTDGQYLIVVEPADTMRRIVFETDGAKVTRYRAGRMPEVEWVEGCS